MPPPATTRVEARPDPVLQAEAVALVEEVTLRTGRRPFDDQQWADLRHGDPERLISVSARAPDGTLEGWAQLSPDTGAPDAGPPGWSLGLAVRGDVDLDEPGGVTDALVATARAELARRGGGALRWWNLDPDPARLVLTARHGLVPTRALLVMHVDLPLAAPAEPLPPTRGFVPGRDDEAWLAVNNRSFAAHPEQGGWTRATLEARMAEPWFDPEGLRLLELDGRLAGFCWTKVDPAQPDGADADAGAVPVGEIYVVAVDPWFQGRGLGRVLTRAGLEWLDQRGLGRAELYVDEANSAAVGLYRALGFDVARVHRAFTGVVAPSDAGSPVPGPPDEGRPDDAGPAGGAPAPAP